MAATSAKKSAKAKSAKPAKKPAKAHKSKPAEAASNAIDEQLARYRSMRDFHITAEPSGSTKSHKNENGTKYPFCIQKHAASHLHYDFRLGWNGVLKSWAVAKGPSYVVADKRLAVQVEDHPMEYGGFEGIIPAGQYGGGTVMLWDQGTWEPQPAYPDVDAGLRDGSLKFILHGQKLQGKWALIRMKPRPRETKPAWLLIKEHDPFERPPSSLAITDEAPNSVVTGRTLDQIAASQDHVWNSKDTRSGDQAWFRQDSKSPPNPGESSPTLPSLTHLPTEAQPTFIPPQLAQQADTPPANDGWLHELKLDGYRIQARKSHGQTKLLTRTGLDWTHRMSDLAAEVARLPAPTATLDGEVVVLAPDGTTSFANLQAAFQEDARHPLTYFAFDLLHLDGHNPRNSPLRDRKALLSELLAHTDPHTLRLSEHLETDGPALFREACKMRAEGIVSKLASSKYTPGRSSAWLKSKCLHEQELVIAGFTLPSAGHAGMRGVGALLLGYYDHAHRPAKLIYAGRAGTGFTQATHKLLRDKLEALAQPITPFAKPPTGADAKGVRWVKPTLVAQVRFATWTADNLVRQAAFLGLREDKPAAEVTRETSAPTPRGFPPSTNPPPIRLTHPDKVLDPASHITKQQLADYYYAVAPLMLPQIAGRPISLVRCPDGCAKPCFFQKHVNAMLPKGIGSIDVPDKKTGVIEPYITLTGASATPEALASLAQLGVLEVHPWGSRNADLEHPDRLIFDLDPDQSLPWSAVAAAATEVRARLRKLGLTSFLKTTGGKGLHVVIPIQPTLTWAEAKDFAHAFVLAMERANPTLYLTKMTKSARIGRIYLDYLRNERGATAVAPYSPRARAGCHVSIPLAWSELTSGLLAHTRPTFSVANLVDWRARLKKDPWKAITTTHQSITRETLAALNIVKP
jgi:bifunctional non-homologous end joining protein LigD